MKFQQTVKEKFLELFKQEPIIVRSPGRVNLIGEHTDYNLGYVLPGAIEKAIYYAVAPREDKICRLYAMDMNDSFEFSIDNPVKSSKGWPNYLMGVVDQFNKMGYKLNGFNCVFGGDIPIGAGLSSSAALEAGLAFTLNHIYNLGVDKLTLVKLSQKAENQFVGVNCGIMDQYISVFGKQGHLLRIDCRSLEYEYFPFNFDNVSIVLFNTNVSHSLASSEYNQRRKECNEGTAVIKQDHPEIESLRDVSVELLEKYRANMNPVVYKRCKYAVEENARLLNACAALNKNDLKTFGSLMYQTHDGLSRDYEVSCKELDFLVELTRDDRRIYGSRMMGGGFGGCTINIIEKSAVEDVSAYILKEYENKFKKKADVYITSISSGTEIMN